MSPINTALLDEHLKVIRAKRGNESVRFADQIIPRARIPMPDFPTLMHITSSRGVGGIPIGCLTRIHGTPSSGKTQLAYWIIRYAQQLRTDRFPNGMMCCYWNVEGQFDEAYAQSLGIDTSKLLIRETDVIEEITEEMEILLTSCHLHVIDSASHATSLEQLAIDPKDWRTQRGVHAAAWKFAISRIHHRMDKHNNVVVVIDHEVTGQDGQMQVLSGQRLAFRADLTIRVSKGAWLFYDRHGSLVTNDKLAQADPKGIGPAGIKQPDGSEVTIECMKSRVCRPTRRGKMRLDLNKMRYDAAFELAEHAVYYDPDGGESHRTGKTPIVDPHGSWYWAPRWLEDGTTGGGRKAKGHWSWDEKDVDKLNGMVALRTYIADNPRLASYVLECIQKDGY
jgi:RecA/RadA recombinase